LTHDLLLLESHLYPLDCCILLITKLFLLNHISLGEGSNSAWKMFYVGKALSTIYTHGMCTPSTPPTPSDPFFTRCYFSLLKYRTLGIIQDRNRKQNFRFFPDKKGRIPMHDNNLYSPSPRVLFFFLWIGKVY
jgi:hypothetical protein